MENFEPYDVSTYPEFVAQRTKRDGYRMPINHLLDMCALGLAGEAGEVVDIIKKIVYHDKPVTPELLHKLRLELGDVEFYLQGLRNALGETRDVIVSLNMDKLTKRYPTGEFTPEAAEARADEV